MMCGFRMVVTFGGEEEGFLGCWSWSISWPGYCVTWVVCSLCENPSSYSLGICVLSCRLDFREKSWKTELIPNADAFSTVSLWFPGYSHWSAGLDWAQVLTWPLSSNFHSEQSAETWTLTSPSQGSCAQERKEQACCNNITRACVFWAPTCVPAFYSTSSTTLEG